MSNNHVAVLPFPFATHAGLLLGLVQRLAKALPDVTFTFFSTAKSNASLFTHQNPCHDNIKPFNVPDGIPEGYVFGGGGIEELIALFFKSAHKNIQNAVKSVEDEFGKKITCVMADAFMWFSGEIAEELGVDWIPVWTSAAGSLSLHVYTDLIRQNVGFDQGIDGRENEILTFIPGFAELRLGDMPSGVVSGNLESPFSVMLYKMGKAIAKATALPINSFEELDPPIVEDLKSKFKNLLHVGPFNLTTPPPSANTTDEHECIAWLDKQEPGSVAYIAFGTVATPPPHELRAMAEALEESKTPFLWSLKDDFVSHFPEGFLERTSEYGKIVPWAPQVQVLGHGSVGVFINHCGWNSVLESIASGVPVIGRPFFGDHSTNAWMVENVWRIGVRVEGGVFTKSGTMLALDLVLSKNRTELKQQIEMYKELALKAVGPSGSSTESFKKLIDIITSCS